MVMTLHAPVTERDEMSRRRPTQAHTSNRERRKSSERYSLGNRFELTRHTSSTDSDNQGNVRCVDRGTLRHHWEEPSETVQ